MSYEAETIANAFLRLAKADGKALSNMKIQKLLYFAQGHSLSLLDEELISDNCEAWDYGPVYPFVYRALKKFGSGAVTEEIHADDDPERFEPKLGKKATSLVQAVWKKYGKFDAIRLSELSHVHAGPWAEVRRKNPESNSEIIGKKRIEKYFKSLAEKA